MKRIVIGIMFILNSSSFNAQWAYQTVDNGFDEKYRIAYTETNNNGFLKLENVDGDVLFYLRGGYFCDDNPNVDLAFMVNGESKKYSFNCVKSNDNTCLFFILDLATSNVFEDFKACTSLKVRVNESYCDTEVYNFNMSKSTTAFNYVLNQ
jgi:hypothetical protein